MKLDYEEFHTLMLNAGDIDPSYEMLKYVCNRFELTQSQRYWLAFLYSTCYCGPTVFYIYNEFPDFENVDEKRLGLWWEANKHRTFFQTDRKWIRSRNHFVPMFQSYKKFIGNHGQEWKFSCLETRDPHITYDIVYEEASQIFQMGRFSLFLYLEAIHVVTGFNMKPRSMEISEAESCRNGLCFAIGHEELMNHFTEKKLSRVENSYLQLQFDSLVERMQKKDPRNNVWNIETTLCAYKKYNFGDRYVGYYLDRQAKEIKKLQAAVDKGVDWNVLWQYRSETYDHKFLQEMR